MNSFVRINPGTYLYTQADTTARSRNSPWKAGDFSTLPHGQIKSAGCHALDLISWIFKTCFFQRYSFWGYMPRKHPHRSVKAHPSPAKTDELRF